MFGKIFSSDKAIYDGIDESEDAHVLTKRKCNAEDEVARVLRDESLKSKAREMGFDVDSEAFRVNSRRSFGKKSTPIFTVKRGHSV